MTALIPAWLDGDLVALDKIDVHRRGLRHPAVSVFLLDRDHILLQRRAAGKYHTPGLWTNTCCTHPHWGEEPQRCALRRLRQELGISAQVLHHAGTVEYRAEVGGGLTEHEVVEIFVGEGDRQMLVLPDPDEVSQTRWIGLDGLRQEIAADPTAFTPWLRIYIADHLDLILGAGAPR
ncbi:MAG: isopentenyl-diphosphate Delta-isomerase [Gemmobacter sp.]